MGSKVMIKNIVVTFIISLTLVTLMIIYLGIDTEKEWLIYPIMLGIITTHIMFAYIVTR